MAVLDEKSGLIKEIITGNVSIPLEQTLLYYEYDDEAKSFTASAEVSVYKGKYKARK